MPDRSGDHLRLGDTEREQASSVLRDHYAEGRLDTEEYSERLDAVWAARTRADLRPVFADLPGPGGASAGESTPESRRGPSNPYAVRRPPVFGWLVPVLMIALAITVVTHLPVVLLVLLVCWILLHRRGPSRRPRHWSARHDYGWH